MKRPAQLREPSFLLLVSALTCAFAGAQTPVHPPAPPAPTKPNLRIDVADPDRSAKEKSGQGMTGERPLNTPTALAPADSSALSGPGVSSGTGRGDAHPLQFRQGSTISFRLTDPLNSGAQHNGDVVHGTLAAPVTTTDGRTLPAGEAVSATVVSAARAGTIASGGTLSIELTHVEGIRVVTDVRVFDGKDGHKDVADSNPGKGSEAEVPAGTLLSFQVMN